MSGYAELIQRTEPTLDPRHVEAYMRLQYGTLDHLDRATFEREVRVAADCVRFDAQGAEDLARSYGLVAS
jgi:hypothetical protein